MKRYSVRFELNSDFMILVIVSVIIYRRVSQRVR